MAKFNLLFPVALLGSVLAGSWAFVFWYEQRHGSYLMQEPVAWIRLTELIVCSLLAVILLIIGVRAYIGMCKRRRR